MLQTTIEQSQPTEERDQELGRCAEGKSIAKMQTANLEESLNLWVACKFVSKLDF